MCAFVRASGVITGWGQPVVVQSGLRTYMRCTCGYQFSGSLCFTLTEIQAKTIKFLNCLLLQVGEFLFLILSWAEGMVF